MQFLSVGRILTATSNATPRSWESTQPEPRKHVCIILYKGVYAMKLASALYINRTQLAEELGVSVATIRNWSSKKDFPKPVRNSGKVPIYKTSEINSWLTLDLKR